MIRSWKNYIGRELVAGKFLLRVHFPPYRMCLVEARLAFVNAIRELKSVQKKKNTILLAAAEGFLQLTDVYIELGNGNLIGATDLLFNLLEKSAGELKMQCYFVLKVIMKQRELIGLKPDSRLINSINKIPAEVIDKIWQFKEMEADILISQGKVQGVFTEIVSQLKCNLGVVKRLELQILLAYTLFKDNRLAESQILLSSIEDEVRKTIIDKNLRYRYLDLCTIVWFERYKREGNIDAKNRALIFLEARKSMERNYSGGF